MIKSIIISGPPAIGKTTIAKGLATEFDLQYISGGDALKELAKEQGFKIQGNDWWDTEEGMDFLNFRQQNFQYDKIVDQKLKEIFQKGEVVITSYTLPWLVDGGIKIWLFGSHQNSAERMKIRDNVNVEQALKIVKKRYAENKSLYKKLYGIDFKDDNTIFDKIIDTSNLSANEVLKIAKSTVRNLL